MDGKELKELIIRNGLFAIPVAMPSDDSPRPPRFVGSLDEFWAAAKVIGAKAAFLTVMQMDESDFEREVSADDLPHGDVEDDDSFDGESYTVDLEKALPSISKFRKHVGKDCAFVIIAKGGLAEIDFLITESWWDEFQEEAEKALDLWMERRSEHAEVVEAKTAKRTTELLGLLKALITDREFCLLKTQRAMLAYAIEKIPELEELDQYILKPEIQTLHARIEARGLNRK